jgi:formate dehydrogenase major subunit
MANMLNLKLNGQAIQAPSGSTVLDAAKSAGIYIPTLCHHPALENLGACRMCVVEIEGEKALQPSCTYPVREGMSIKTDTPRVLKLRKFVLEMLFSERNHYCMFCEMSGDCELQNLAYQYGLDHWTYPTPNPRLSVDGTRKFFIMDHNRCILCRRCIRACSDIVANHTLGVKFRGAKTMISADMGVPFGSSSCVSCGTCLQVCPTGALVDRKSAYMGRNIDTQKISSQCSFCSIGCSMQIIKRGGRVLRVEGDWQGANQGVLCHVGRFDPFYDTRDRVLSPMIRKGASLVPVSWEEALNCIAGKIKEIGQDKVKAWITTKALKESMDAFVNVFEKKIGIPIGALESTLLDLNLPVNGTLSDIDHSNCILIVGTDPLIQHLVLGYRVKRARNHGTKIIQVGGDIKNGIGRYAHIKFEFSNLDDALKICLDSEMPVVLYGEGLGITNAEKLKKLESKAKFIPLFPASNGHYARELGLQNGVKRDHAYMMYVLLEDLELREETIQTLKKSEFVVAHSSYLGAVSEFADVILPAPLWYEREGTFVNSEGQLISVKAAMNMPETVISEADALNLLAQRF